MPVDGRTSRSAERLVGRTIRLRRWPVRRRAGGQVIVIMLFGMSLLVGLVFFVYNVGDQVNSRLEMQNTADSVAISGAGWIARSMNAIAMNNFAQAKLIGLIPVLDAFPLASRMAWDEAKSWAEGLQQQLDRGVPSDFLREGLESVRDRMFAERDILEPFKQALNDGGFNMETVTHWSVRGSDGGTPHGTIWRGAVTLDEFSQAALASSSLLSQHEAVRFGERNRADAAFIVPVVPSIPARRGQFANFGPIMQGRLHVTDDGASYRATGGRGGAIPDYAFPHRLGPYARLHRWRDRTREATNRVWVPPREGARVRSGQGSVNIGGRRRGNSAMQRSSGHGGYWRNTGWVESGYTTYGPYDWALRRVRWYSLGRRYHPYNYDGELSDLYFYTYVKDISRIKLGYMFGDKTPRMIHYPTWITDYPRSRTIASDPNARIDRTMFYLVEIVSSVPEGDPRWLTSGTYRTNGQRPIAIWVNGWEDPADWNVPKIADYIWQDSYTYQTTRDTSIGIYPQRGADGREVFQTVYLVAYYVFGGIDVGGEVQVSNPCNWEADDELPAPMLLDTTAGDYEHETAQFGGADEGFRRERFTFLGVARRGNRAPVWPQRFYNPNPLGSTLTLAQAKVFNNTSWDLWTQDWRVSLAPVTRWDDWVLRLERGAAEAGLTNGMVTQAEVEAVHEFMNRLNHEMADKYMRH